MWFRNFSTFWKRKGFFLENTHFLFPIIFVFLFVGCTFSQKEAISPLINLEDTEELLVFPRNISDVYKGSWFSKDNQTKTMDPLGFQKLHGHFIIHLNNKPSVIKEIDTVNGDLIIRDGIYSTDFNSRFIIQGIYFWKIGILFLVSNPLRFKLKKKKKTLLILILKSEPIIDDFIIDLNQNESIYKSIQRAESYAFQKFRKPEKKILFF